MLSYKNENGNVKELAAGGTMRDMLAESAYLLTAVYSMLARRVRRRRRFSRRA